MSESNPILLIDGDKNHIATLKTILQEKGYEVDFAHTGPDGLKKVILGKYSVVIMGYALPMMKGGELAERIRRIDDKVRLILLTSYKQTIPPSVQSKFNSIIEKPINTQKILEALRANLNALHSYNDHSRRIE